MRKYLLIACIYCSSTPTLAVDYKQEIINHVVAPCWDHGMAKKGIDKNFGMPRKEFIELMIVAQSGMVETIVGSLLPLVRNKDYSSRRNIYGLGRKNCITGVDLN